MICALYLQGTRRAFVMEKGGHVYADYELISGDNVTGGGVNFIVNFTEMVAVCPVMTEEDRALLRERTRIPSGAGATMRYRSSRVQPSPTFLIRKVLYCSRRDLNLSVGRGSRRKIHTGWCLGWTDLDLGSSRYPRSGWNIPNISKPNPGPGPSQPPCTWIEGTSHYS